MRVIYTYTPSAWYWVIGGSTTQVWSSAAAAFVPVTDTTYTAWLKTPGNVPARLPNLAALTVLLGIQYPAGMPKGQPTQLSSLDFMALFTVSEQAAIVTAALAQPAVFLWYSRMLCADYIDLTNTLTRQGLDALVAAGLLTAPRELAILANQAPPSG